MMIHMFFDIAQEYLRHDQFVDRVLVAVHDYSTPERPETVYEFNRRFMDGQSIVIRQSVGSRMVFDERKYKLDGWPVVESMNPAGLPWAFYIALERNVERALDKLRNDVYQRSRNYDLGNDVRQIALDAFTNHPAWVHNLEVGVVFDDDTEVIYEVYRDGDCFETETPNDKIEQRIVENADGDHWYLDGEAVDNFTYRYDNLVVVRVFATQPA